MFDKRPLKFRTTQRADHPTASDSDHTRVVGYVRVSTDMQALEGVSLDAQSEKSKAYCKLHEVERIGLYKDEGLSAKSLERPGLKSVNLSTRARRSLQGRPQPHAEIAALDH